MLKRMSPYPRTSYTITLATVHYSTVHYGAPPGYLASVQAGRLGDRVCSVSCFRENAVFFNQGSCVILTGSPALIHSLHSLQIRQAGRSGGMRPIRWIIHVVGDRYSENHTVSLQTQRILYPALSTALLHWLLRWQASGEPPDSGPFVKRTVPTGFG